MCTMLLTAIIENKKISLSNERLLQVGALVYRINQGKIETLLITSRTTKRWIIPKGWPIPGKTLAQAALCEAYEEAGIRGAVEATPIGRYDYEKSDVPQEVSRFSVDVFAVFYSHQEKKWPERGQRVFEWLSREEAAERVAEPGLKEIFLTFTPH